jgi:hypothetical protein
VQPAPPRRACSAAYPAQYREDRRAETPRGAVGQALEIKDGVDQGQAAQHELADKERHQSQPRLDARGAQHVGHRCAHRIGEADVFGDQTGIGQ